MKKLLSVVVLTYKQVNYIRECIDSILNQEVNFDYEVIVGDDASNDGTKEILEEYKSKYKEKFVLAINKENVGANANYLNTLGLCKGKYIATIEGDDYWCDTKKLQKQVDYLEQHKNISAVATSYYIVDHDGKNKKNALSKSDTDRCYDMKTYLKHGMVVHSNTLMYRNNLPLYDEKFKTLFSILPTMGDVIIRSYIYDMGDLYALPDCTLCHRITESVVQSSFQAQEKRNIFTGTYMMLELVKGLKNYYPKYDFKLLVCNRMAKTLFLKIFKNINCDMNEYRSLYRSFKTKYKFIIIKGFLYHTCSAVKRTIERQCQKKIRNKKDE